MKRALILIWELLKQHGCREAARLISLALFTLKLPAGFLTGQPLTIFVPSDDAMRVLPAAEYDQLITRKGRRNLLRTMLDHAAVESQGAATAGETEYRSITGERISVQDDESQIRTDRPTRVMKELRAGPHRILIVDRVLSGSAERRTARLRRS
jgi:hypothetical protein